MNYLHRRFAVLLFCVFTITISLFAQPPSCDMPNEWDGYPTSSMTFMVTSSAYNSLPPIQSSDAYIVVLNNNNLVVGSACIADDCLIDEQQSVPIWADDQFTEEIDGALNGDDLFWFLVDGSNLYTLFPTTFDIPGMGGDDFIINGQGVISSFDYNLECSIEEDTPDEEIITEISDPCTSLSDYNSILLDLNPIQKRDFNEGWNMFGFPCQQPRSVSETFSEIVNEIYIIKNNEGNFYWPEFYFDGIGNLIPLEGYQTKLYNPIYDFRFCTSSINLPQINISGCSECEACNYNPLATSDIDLNSTLCIYPNECYDCFGIFICGCTDDTAFNYNPDAIQDDGSCTAVIEGCMDPDAFNYDDAANTAGYCEDVVIGCMDPIAENFNSNANTAGVTDIDLVFNWAPSTNSSVYVQISKGDFQNQPAHQELLDHFDFPSYDIDWDSLIVAEPQNGGSISYSVEPTGDIYRLSDLDYDLIWTGYQEWEEVIYLFLTLADGQTFNSCYFEDIDSNYLCTDPDNPTMGLYDNEEWSATLSLINSNSESCIYSGCMDPEADNFNPNATLPAFPPNFCEYLGCLDEGACNYNPVSNIDDGSCEYAEQYYDCDGNITEYVIGMQAEGGIVFYIDETGEHGLVASEEDITEGAYSNGFRTGFPWGCSGQDYTGAEGTALFTGYQNSQFIVDFSETQNCSSPSGSVSAAEKCLNYNHNGYDDWYLPSKETLILMSTNIGPGPNGSYGNIGNFVVGESYWSSSEGDVNLNTAWSVIFYDYNSSISGTPSDTGKNNLFSVRAVRSF